MNAETLSALAGVLLSLAASYLPGFRAWFDGLEADRKRLVMLAALALAATGTALLAISQSADSATSLDTASWLRVAGQVIESLIAAAVANQAAYALTPRRGR